MRKVPSRHGLGSWLLSAGLLALVGCDDTLFGLPVDGLHRYDPTWSEMERMFTNHCDGCHPAISDPDLHEAIRDDIEGLEQQFVIPGDAENSLLWQVLAGTSDEVAPMPYGTGGLPDVSIEHVKTWIDDGASLTD